MVGFQEGLETFVEESEAGDLRAAAVAFCGALLLAETSDDHEHALEELTHHWAGVRRRFPDQSAGLANSLAVELLARAEGQDARALASLAQGLIGERSLGDLSAESVAKLCAFLARAGFGDDVATTPVEHQILTGNCSTEEWAQLAHDDRREVLIALTRSSASPTSILETLLESGDPEVRGRAGDALRDRDSDVLGSRP